MSPCLEKLSISPPNDWWFHSLARDSLFFSSSMKRESLLDPEPAMVSSQACDISMRLVPPSLRWELVALCHRRWARVGVPNENYPCYLGCLWCDVSQIEISPIASCSSMLQECMMFVVYPRVTCCKYFECMLQGDFLILQKNVVFAFLDMFAAGIMRHFFNVFAAASRICNI